MNGTVLIAGGGPSGLMAACELRLAGVDVVVFERLDEPPLWSRSGILQMRTVEVFRQRGMDFFAGYGPARTYNFGLIEMKGIIDPDLVALRVPQRDIELRLDARARELGADLRRGHTLVGLSDLGDAVRVEVEGPTGRYELTGDYLLGCDGGSSVVRKLAGIPFAGGGPSMPFSGLTGDIQVLDPPARPIGPELHPRGMFALFPAPDGRYRVTVLEFGAQAPDGDVPVTAAEVAEGARRVAGVEVAFGEDNLLSRFSGSTLLAESYPARTCVPRRRRGARAPALRRAGAERGAAGRGQPRLEARRRTYTAWRRPDCSTRTTASGTRSVPGPDQHPGAAVLYLSGVDAAPLLGDLAALMQHESVQHLVDMVSGLDIRYDVGPGPSPLLGRCRSGPMWSSTAGSRQFGASAPRPRRAARPDRRPAAAEIAAGWADRVDVGHRRRPARAPGTDARAPRRLRRLGRRGRHRHRGAPRGAADSPVR